MRLGKGRKEPIVVATAGFEGKGAYAKQGEDNGAASFSLSLSLSRARLTRTQMKVVS